MNESILVSVVMPMYNMEKYIERSIKSVLNQTYNNWELVIADDGSTDNSVKLAKSFTDPRIRIVTKGRLGGAKAARDYAVLNSYGTYVLYLDADDYLEDHYIEKTISAVLKTKADIVTGVMEFYDEEGNKTSQLPSNDDLYKTITGYNAFKSVIYGWRLPFNGALVKKGIMNRLKAERMAYEDYIPDELDSRIYFDNSNLVYTSDARYFFGVNNNSETRRVSIKRYYYFNVINQLYEYCKNKYENDKEIMKLAELQRASNLVSYSYLLAKQWNSLGDCEKKELKVLFKKQYEVNHFCEIKKLKSFKSILIYLYVKYGLLATL